MTVAILCGLVGGYGLVRLLNGFLGRPPRHELGRHLPVRAVAARGGVALVAAAAAAGLTTWPVAAPLAAAGAVAAPRLYARWQRDQRREAQVPAVLAWDEMLRDAIAAGAGIETAIRATAHGEGGLEPPVAIAAELSVLVTRLDDGIALDLALRLFADDVDDAHADMVVAALLLAIKNQAGKLVEQLTAIADALRDEVNGREAIATERSRVRTQLVIIGLAICAGLGFYAVYLRSYLRPYGTVQGQIVLLVIGVLFAIGAAWLAHLARPFRPPRLLTPVAMAERLGAVAPAALALAPEVPR